MANGDQTYNTQVNQLNKTFKYYYNGKYIIKNEHQNRTGIYW